MDFRTASRKAAARVLHQMPAVGDLNRVRKSPLRRDRIAAATIPGDDTDLRVQRKPRLSRSRLPIGQKSDRRATFKVADQRAVAVIAPPGPVIDADNRRRRKASRSAMAHHAQQRVIAHHDVEPTRKGGSRPASERNGETVDHVVEPARASGSRFDRLEPFGEDPPRASSQRRRRSGGSAKSALSGRRRPEDRPAASDIGCARGCKRLRARGAAANARRASYRDDEAVVVFHRALNHEFARNKLRNVKPLHSSDPQPESEPNRRLDFIKCKSEPNRDPL